MNKSFTFLNRCKILVSALFCLLLYSCRDTVDRPYDYGYGYFPEETGRWWEYEVDSIYHDADVGVHDTSNFILREMIESKFLDNQGRESNRIERIKKFNDTIDWTEPEIWTSTRTSAGAERYEENVRYIRLAYPILLSQQWNGNQYNTLPPWNYKYTAIDQPYTIGTLHFDSTVTVIQVDFISLISKEYVFEVYAKNVGLIHKKHIEISFDSITNPTLGIEYEYKIKAWGGP